MTPRSLRLSAAVVVVALVAGVAGCGSGDDRPSASDAGGPVTVEQLLARAADTPVAVQGLLHIDRGTVRLCAAILESYPPQCGEPSVELVGVDPAIIEDVSTAAGVTWKEGAVLNVERSTDGRFIVVDAEADVDVQIVLGLYSGVPDPTWMLTTQQANELAEALAGLTKSEAAVPSGGLGYHGFSITSPDSTLVAYAGKVASAQPEVLDDPDRTIERFLLETAQPYVTPEEFAIVAEALGEP